MEQHLSHPILSICIPTYNRAPLLKSALDALIHQVKKRTSEVEVIISDNNSIDDTAEVVRRAQKMIPIRYYRNAKNMGIARNIQRLTNELAEGEFAWVLGDDDMILPGALDRVLGILERYPDVDYVFVNLLILPYEKRHAAASYFAPDLRSSSLSNPTKSKNLDDRYVRRWEELIDPEVDEVFLGSCMVSVFRLAVWKTYQLRDRLAGSVWSSLEEAYFVPVVLAHTMIGRRAFYIGHPCVLTTQGGQDWHDHLAVIVAVRIQELLDLYLQLGIDRLRVERCRRAALEYSAWAVQRLLSDPTTPGRHYFSFRKFLWTNKNHPAQLLPIFLMLIAGKSPFQKVISGEAQAITRKLMHWIVTRIP